MCFGNGLILYCQEICMWGLLLWKLFWLRTSWSSPLGTCSFLFFATGELLLEEEKPTAPVLFGPGSQWGERSIRVSVQTLPCQTPSVCSIAAFVLCLYCTQPFSPKISKQVSTNATILQNQGTEVKSSSLARIMSFSRSEPMSGSQKKTCILRTWVLEVAQGEGSKNITGCHGVQRDAFTLWTRLCSDDPHSTFMAHILWNLPRPCSDQNNLYKSLNSSSIC